MERIVNKQLDQFLANNKPHYTSRLIHGDRRSRLDPWRNLLVDWGRETDVRILCGTLDEPASKFNTLGNIGRPPNRLRLRDELKHEAARIFYGENTWVVDDYQDLEEFVRIIGSIDGQYVHTLVFREAFVTDPTIRGADGLTPRQRTMIVTLRDHFGKLKNIQFRLTSWDYTMYASRSFIEALADLDSVTRVSLQRPDICPAYAREYAAEESQWLDAIRTHYLRLKPGEMEVDSPLHSPDIRGPPPSPEIPDDPMDFIFQDDEMDLFTSY